VTNWPWPLDGVQNWFEDLWDWISTAAVNAVSVVSTWIKDGLAGLKRSLDASFSWVGTQLTNARNTLEGAISSALSGITGALDTARVAIVNALSPIVTGVGQTLGSAIAGVGAQLAQVSQGLATTLSTSASWVASQVTSGLSSLRSAVMLEVSRALQGGMDWVTSALRGVSEAMGASLQAFFRWLIDGAVTLATSLARVVGAVRGAIEVVLTPISRGIVEALTSSVKAGSPDPEILRAASEFADGYLKKMVEAAGSAPKSVPKLDELLPRAIGVVGLNLTAAMITETAGVALDQAHPIKNMGFRDIAMDLVASAQFPAVVGPILGGPVWPSILIPLRYRYNEMFPTSVPGPGELASMAAHRNLAADEYRQVMKFHALDESWSSRLLAQAYRIPVYAELQAMFWRKKVTGDQLQAALRSQGVREDFVEGYVELLSRIPGPDDLIRFAVREALTRPELDAELPEELVASMALQGYAEIYSRYWWRAHWVLVPLGNLYQMFHRGIIDAGTLSAQLKYHDYTPEWRDRLVKLSWRLPGRIDARWMFRWGEIDVTQLRDLLVAEGLDPEWADRVASAYAKNQWLVEINRLRDNLKADFVKGYAVEGQLRAGLAALGYPSAWIDFHVRDAVEDADRRLRDSTVKALGDAYLKDLVTDDQLEARLRSVIVRPEALEAELERLYVLKYAKAKAPAAAKVAVLPVSTLRSAFREGVIDEATLRGELEARDYAAEDVDLIVALELTAMEVAA